MEAADRLTQHVVDAIEGVERRERILKDRLDRASKLHSFSRRHRRQVLALVQDLARARAEVAKQQMSQRRLAAATLAGDGGDRRSIVGNGERHVVKGHDRFAFAQPATARIHAGGITQLEQRRHQRSVQVTRHAVLRREKLQHWRLRPAAFERVRTARRERAARR